MKSTSRCVCEQRRLIAIFCCNCNGCRMRELNVVVVNGQSDRRWYTWIGGCLISSLKRKEKKANDLTFSRFQTCLTRSHMSILMNKFNTHIQEQSIICCYISSLDTLILFLSFVRGFLFQEWISQSGMGENGNALYLQSHCRYRQQQYRHRTQTLSGCTHFFHLECVVMCVRTACTRLFLCAFAFNEITCQETFFFGLS